MSGVARDQVADRGGVGVDAGDRIAREPLPAGAGSTQRGARAPLDAGGKALGGEPAILDVEQGAEDHDLAGEVRA